MEMHRTARNARRRITPVPRLKLTNGLGPMSLAATFAQHRQERVR